MAVICNHRRNHTKIKRIISSVGLLYKKSLKCVPKENQKNQNCTWILANDTFTLNIRISFVSMIKRVVMIIDTIERFGKPSIVNTRLYGLPKLIRIRYGMIPF